MPSEHGGVCREDGGDVDVAQPADQQTDAGDPLVEMRHDVRFLR